MSIFTKFAKTAESLGEVFRKLNDNPIVSHAIDWFGDYLMGHMFIKKHLEGKTTREIDPKWLRTEAPALFAATSLDENLLREITYSKHLKVGHRVELFDKWGPDSTVTIPNPALGQIGMHQWDDFRLSLVQELFKQGDPALELLADGERQAKIKELCEFLTELVKLPKPARIGRLYKIHYCKPDEGDYKIVKFQRIRNKVFRTTAQFVADFIVWLDDPGPTGFRELSVRASAHLDAASPVMRAEMGRFRNYLDNTVAPDVAPSGLMGWLIK